MIKFFRRIRKKLLTENKFSKYLLYAIGEIALVVLGILIALQLNTWNTERLNRIQEQVYLKRLIIDLERDLTNLELSVESHQLGLAIGKNVADQLGDNFTNSMIESVEYQDALKVKEQRDDWIPDSYGESLFWILRIALFTQISVTFDELISTGKIDIIQDQTLRTMIQEHYPKVMEFQNFQNGIIMTVQENYRNALIANNISSLNNESFEEVYAKLSNTEGLILAIENYMVLSRAALFEIRYTELSVENNTRMLIAKIKEGIN